MNKLSQTTYNAFNLYKQGKTGIPIDDCCKSVGENVALTTGLVCTSEVGKSVDVEGKPSFKKNQPHKDYFQVAVKSFFKAGSL